MKVHHIVEADPTFSSGKTTSGGIIVPDNFKVEQLDPKTDFKKAAEDLEKKTKGSKKPFSARRLKVNAVLKARKMSRFFARMALWKLTIAAQGFVIFNEYSEQYAAVEELWKWQYPEGHAYALGSPYAQEQINRLTGYHAKSMYAALATVAVATLAEIITTGKIAKTVRALNTASNIVAVTGWGLIIKAIVWAATQGAIWYAGSLIQKYGPDFFQALANDTLADYLKSEGVENANKSSGEAPTIDPKEVRQQVEKELNKDQSSGSSSVSDLANKARAAMSTKSSGPRTDTGKGAAALDANRYSFGR
jgi:hypothetical protein